MTGGEKTWLAISVALMGVAGTVGAAWFQSRNTDAHCIPGDLSDVCPGECSDGRKRYRRCLETGKRWGPCECDPATSVTPVNHRDVEIILPVPRATRRDALKAETNAIRGRPPALPAAEEATKAPESISPPSWTAPRAATTADSLPLAAPTGAPVQPEANDKAHLANLRKRAVEGNAEAQFALGHAFEAGLLGLQQDAFQATQWYEKAASQGVELAREGVEDLTMKNARLSPKDKELRFIKRQIESLKFGAEEMQKIHKEFDERAKEAIQRITES
jgi:hypothetical protein